MWDEDGWVYEWDGADGALYDCECEGDGVECTDGVDGCDGALYEGDECTCCDGLYERPLPYWGVPLYAPLYAPLEPRCELPGSVRPIVVDCRYGVGLTPLYCGDDTVGRRRGGSACGMGCDVPCGEPAVREGMPAVC